MADEWDEALAAEVDDDDVDVDGTDEQSQNDPAPLYPNVEAWVVGYFAQIMRRPNVGRSNGPQWCPEWWRHPEALSVLEALWRSWEFLRRDGTTGISVWWRDHLNPHWNTISGGETSPFKGCSAKGGHADEWPQLECAPAPPGWFDDAEEEEAATAE